jgi:hypothetical protein
MTLGNGIGFAEASIRVCHFTLSKTSKESRSHLHCGGSLKSRINATSFGAEVFMWRENTKYICVKKKGKAVSTVTGLQWPTGFQEVKVPRFHDNGTGWW